MGNWSGSELLRWKETPARWIWARFASPVPRNQVALFHAEVVPPAGTRRVEMFVSAEGRYTLWLNDEREPLGRGPARTDGVHRSVDPFDLESEGAAKAIQVWAQVRYVAGVPEAPVAEMVGALPGFLAMVIFYDEADRVLGVAGTDGSWRAVACGGLEMIPIRHGAATFAIGQGERQRSSMFPGDWRKGVAPGDARWEAAEVGEGPYFAGDREVPWGTGGRAWLAEREIPFPEERPVFARQVVRAADGGWEAVESAQVRLSAGERATLRVDVGEHVNAYYRVHLRGAGTRCRVTASEVLLTGTEPAKKTFSLETAGTVLVPVVDEFVLEGEAFTFESGMWRAFRFLEVTVEAGAGGGELVSLESIGTNYPHAADYSLEMPEAAAGGAERETLQKIVDVSWRTLRDCSWETYMDGPGYEQLQYVGDARIQCLLTYVTTGDVTLPVQALRAFDRSRLPEGLTQSRYPSSVPQIIPTFSLIYILMIEDYLEHAGDEALVAELRPGIAPILNWFTQFTDTDTGLIGYVPYWPFVDWVKGWEKGIPPHAPDAAAAPGKVARYAGTSASINLLYLLALQSATRIYDRAKPGSGNFYNSRAAALKQRVFDTFFDGRKGLLCDVPIAQHRGKPGIYSQHAQALGVLAEVFSPSDARRAMTAALDPQNVLWPNETVAWGEREAAASQETRFIAPASLYFLFYVAEAIAKLRMGEYVWPLLAPFRTALARGSTTWPEAFEPARSECHAWSAWPLYFLARHALGIAPPSLEDNRLRLRPLHCPPLHHLVGHFQTHRGPVNVDVEWKNGKREIKAGGPALEILGE